MANAFQYLFDVLQKSEVEHWFSQSDMSEVALALA